MRLSLLFALLLSVVSCDADNKAKAEKAAVALKAKAKKGSFTDARDNKTYKTVKLDNQTWMAENLNYNASGSKCYENKESNCQEYGRLYNWETAMSACPHGWHLPSNDEWQLLVDLVKSSGGEAKTMLKASSGWYDYEGKSGNGVDAVGFSALPGGCGGSDGSFGEGGESGLWWSASEGGASGAFYEISYGLACVIKGYFYSVRCLQD